MFVVAVEGWRTLDLTQRVKIYYDAQKVILEQLPWVPLSMPFIK